MNENKFYEIQSYKSFSQQKMQQIKSKKRVLTEKNDSRMLETLREGFNYFHQVNFPHFKVRKPRKKTLPSSKTKSFIEQSTIYDTLEENRAKLEKVKTEVNDLRETQFNDYIRKSIRYQELLQINDEKKKRLPTLNNKVGEVVKKSVGDNFPKTIIYQITNEKLKIQGWKPESREGHTVVIYKDQAILIGGHCSCALSAINVYSFFTNTWIKRIQSSFARSYHTTVVYRNKYAILFGGMGIYDKSRKSRQCYNTIGLIDLMSLSARTLSMQNQDSIEPRRCHTATLLGKFMLVLGGINLKRDYLNDFIYLDLKELRWYHKEYRVEGKQLEDFLSSGIAKHAAVSTFKSRRNYPFYSSEYEESEAIFFFGGFNGENQQNVVFQLVLNKLTPTFRRVQYTGTPPFPVNPLIQSYNQNSILIVSGQAGDRELRLFKVKEKSFTLINTFLSEGGFGGIGSSLSLYNDEYYLFYGLGESGYIGTITKFKISERIKQNENAKKKRLKQNNFLLKTAVQLSSDSSDEGFNF